MPLPQPTYPPVVPQTFLTARDERLLSKGLELYARYHPAAMQQQMYQTLLEDEDWEGAQESEKTKRLVQERQRIVDMRAQLQAARATGGTVSGSGQRTSGGVDETWKHLSGLQSRDWGVAQKTGPAQRQKIKDSYELSSIGRNFNNLVMQRLRAQRTLSGPVLKSVLDEVIDKVLLGPGEAIKDVDEDQWRVIAADLWSRLEGVEGFAQLDGFAMDAEGRVLEGARSGENVARLIDEALNTGGWLTSLRRESIRPLSALAADRRAELAGAEPQYPDYGKPRDLDGDGTISAEEQEVAAAKDPERLFEERIRSLDAQIAAQERRSSPMARAARRTLGRPVEPVPGPDELPYVSPEALQAAAAAGGNIAAESLPYAIRRVQQGQGTIKPETEAEAWVEGWLAINQERSFPQFVEEMNRRFDGPNAEKDKREAAAYYGAFYYNQDLKSQTLNQGLLQGNAQEASGTVEKQFQQEVEQDPSVGAGTVLAEPTSKLSELRGLVGSDEEALDALYLLRNNLRANRTVDGVPQDLAYGVGRSTETQQWVRENASELIDEMFAALGGDNAEWNPEALRERFGFHGDVERVMHGGGSFTQPQPGTGAGDMYDFSPRPGYDAMRDRPAAEPAPPQASIGARLQRQLHPLPVGEIHEFGQALGRGDAFDEYADWVPPKLPGPFDLPWQAGRAVHRAAHQRYPSGTPATLGDVMAKERRFLEDAGSLLSERAALERDEFLRAAWPYLPPAMKRGDPPPPADARSVSARAGGVLRAAYEPGGFYEAPLRRGVQGVTDFYGGFYEPGGYFDAPLRAALGPGGPGLRARDYFLGYEPRLMRDPRAMQNVYGEVYGPDTSR